MFVELSEKIVDKGIRIAYPEATDERVLGAAVRLKAAELVEPVLIGDPVEIRGIAEKYRWNLQDMEIIDPNNFEDFDALVEQFLERRKGKNTREEAQTMLRDNAYFGTMLVQAGLAEGLVCGATYSTSDTVRPALQIIKTKPNVKLTSGAFVMVPPSASRGQKLIFADCAININPGAQELAEIAVESARTARMFGIDPKVAMLSFSTNGSAYSEEVEKVIQATKIAKELDPELEIDGELQFDAAIIESVAAKKSPESEVAGKANVLVFPTLDAGNIGYKIAQRLGNYDAVGPILQGLNKPISDLSRGCTEDDVYNVSIITANQTLA